MKIKLINEMDKRLTPTQQVLVNRGIALEDIEHFLNTTDDDICDFNDLDNMDIGVETLLKHINQKSKILIQVDSDVDGFTSAAVLYNFIVSNFPAADIDYQVHKEKTHGLEITEDIKHNKYGLIIVPDAGSNEYDKHKILKDLNIDCIILDHHDCEKESEDAIVINNQLSKNYANKALSGVGIVWQFCRAIESVNENTQVTFADQYLDLVALGLVADMMDLRSLETRRLVDKGLAIMNSGKEINQNTFLADFVKKQEFSLKPAVTPTGISFYIAPFINSIVRVGTLEERQLIFECFLEDKANEIIPSTKRGAKGEFETRATQGARTAINVKNRQKREEDKAAERLLVPITSDYLKKNSIVVLDTGGVINKNLNGLIANQAQSRFKRPSLVISRKDGKVTGSGRGYESNVLSDFREFINESNLANYAEGHAQAFGVEFTEENFDKFIEYANKNLDYGHSYKEYEVDFIIDEKDLDINMMLELGQLKHLWGKGVEEPLIAITNVEVSASKKVLMSKNANPTLKIIANELDCIKFRSSEAEYEALTPNSYTVSVVNIVGKPNLNIYYNKITPQIFITEYEIIDEKIKF